MTKSFSQRIEKPWGFEIIYTQRSLPFTGKIAFTRAGERWSFQLHEKKEETLCLVIGEAELWLESKKGEIEKIRMDSLRGYTIEPGQKHRFCAISDCWTVEASTPEIGLTVRLADDYRRKNEKITAHGEKN